METQQGQQLQSRLQETTWEGLSEPGAYVDVQTGSLFRVPPEALVRGCSPIISRTSSQTSRLVKVSDNPAVPLLAARNIAADHNIEPNF